MTIAQLRTGRLASRWAVLGIAAAAALVMTGCSAGTPTPKAKGALTVGIVNFDTTSITANSFASANEKHMTAKGWTVLNQDAKGAAGQGNTVCAQYVTKKVDAIILNIFEVSQMAQCLSQAKAAEIPVFFIGSSLADGMAGAVSTIVPKPINEAFIADSKARGDVQVLTLTYNPGAPCRVREDELKKALTSASGITVEKHEIVIPGQVTDAQAATQAWLTAHPVSKGEKLAVWACFSDPGIGALAALNQVSRPGVPIYTWDFTKQTIDPIKKGEIAATLWVDADGMAEQMITMITDHLAGGKPTEVEAANKVITADNIDAFIKSHPDAAQ